MMANRTVGTGPKCVGGGPTSSEPHDHLRTHTTTQSSICQRFVLAALRLDPYSYNYKPTSSTQSQHPRLSQPRPSSLALASHSCHEYCVFLHLRLSSRSNRKRLIYRSPLKSQYPRQPRTPPVNLLSLPSAPQIIGEPKLRRYGAVRTAQAEHGARARFRLRRGESGSIGRG